MDVEELPGAYPRVPPMLHIRPEQWAALAGERERAFRERARAHLAKHFPARCAELGAEGLEKTVALGVERARGHGLKHEVDVLRYLNTMLVLGVDFDRSGEYPWAAEILADEDCDPRSNLERLCARTREELARRQR